MVYPLRDDLITLGRSTSNTIQVIDKRASRHHLSLRRNRDGYAAEDMGSKNGTLINDEPMAGLVRLKSGDRISLGDTILIYEREPGDADGSGSSGTRPSNVRLVVNELATRREEVRVDSTNPVSSTASVSREVLADPFERLKVLYTIADDIRSEIQLDELLQKIMNVIWNVLNPYRGVILLKDEREGMLEPVVVRTREGDSDNITISRGIVERSMAERLSILVSDAPSDVRFSANQSVIIGRIRSAICAPLVFQDEVLGVLYLDALDPGPVYYTNDELELVSGIANQAATAIANARLHRHAIETQRLEKELEIARTIQMNLLPKVFPDIDNLDISAMSLPARQVGGDYYDFIADDVGRTSLVVADVSGKGVAAALLSATVRASVRTEVTRDAGLDVAEIVATINRWTCSDATNNMFVTMVFARYDPETMVLEYSNAGHCHPLLFRQDGSMGSLDKGGCFLGIMEQVEYESEHVSLQPGDTLVFYTDGVTDAQNKDQERFGIERLVEVVKQNLDLPARGLRDRIYEAADDFSSGQEMFDDLTILIAKVR